MKCARCDSKRPIKAVPIQYDYSKKAGIDGCFITAKEYTCKKCENVVIDLGEYDDINKAIAEVLTSSECLTRQMIKFIRIQYFDESSFVFAKRLGTNPTVYKEIEDYKRPMTQLVSDIVQEQLVKKLLRKPSLKIRFD